MQNSLMLRNKYFRDRLIDTIVLLLCHSLVRSVLASAWLCILLFIFTSNATGQTKPLSLQDGINIAIKNNLQVKTASLEVQQSKALHKTSFDPPKTNITLIQDPTSGGNIDNALAVMQNFALPGLYKNQKNVLQQQTLLTEKNRTLTQAEIVFNVKQSYNSLLYALEKIKVFNYLDSIYNDFSKKADVRYRTGETSNLEKLTAQSKYQEVQLLKKEALADVKVSQYSLQQLLNISEPILIADDSLIPIMLTTLVDTSAIKANPFIDYYKQNINVANASIQLEKAKLLPDFTFGYYHQFLIKAFNPANINRKYFNGTRIGGIQAGISIPLFRGSYRARINAQMIGVSIAQSQLAGVQQKLQTQWLQAYQEYLKYKQSLDYYQSSGLQLANEQIRVAQFAFSQGEIGYVEFIQNLSLATQTKINYLSTVNLLNAAVINLQYLQGAQQ
jgi:cobalt-zinc-cadmium resistance protein CzcA